MQKDADSFYNPGTHLSWDSITNLIHFIVNPAKAKPPKETVKDGEEKDKSQFVMSPIIVPLLNLYPSRPA